MPHPAAPSGIEEPILVMADVPVVTDALTAIGRPFVLAGAVDLDHFLATDGRRVRVLVQLGRTVADACLLDALPALGLIAVLGAGYEGLDVAQLAARGVAVTNGRGVNAEDVADVAIGLIVGIVRRVVEGDRMIRAGQWTVQPPFPRPSRSLSQLRFGIVGLGAIGMATAQRLRAFGGPIAWWGPRPRPEAPFVRAESLVGLARDSDVLVVTARAGEETRGLIGDDVLAALGPGGYLVNVSRGEVVDQAALFRALSSARLAGAALDVFDREPFADAGWNRLDNVVMTPHLAGWAEAGMQRARGELIANILAFREGRPLLTPVCSGGGL